MYLGESTELALDLGVTCVKGTDTDRDKSFRNRGSLSARPSGNRYLLPAVGVCLEDDLIKCQKPKREHRLAAGFCFSSEELIRPMCKGGHIAWFIW